MRELAVQSSNDTNTTEDRKEIQNEINQLEKKLTVLVNTTEFNTKKLIKWSLNDGTVSSNMVLLML